MKIKNKTAKQEEDRLAHKRQLEKTKKCRCAEPDLSRPKPQRTEARKILIVCGGDNTEISYFRQFRLTNVNLETESCGKDPLSIVKRAILSLPKKYDEIWCVFDKDDFDNFNEAVHLAQENKLKVAYSNQSFEYWLLLHLSDHQGESMHRNNYNNRINKLINHRGITYDGKGKKLVSPIFFDYLYPKIETAVKRAKKIHEYHTELNRNPADSESSTTVYKLVEKLFKKY